MRKSLLLPALCAMLFMLQTESNAQGKQDVQEYSVFQLGIWFNSPEYTRDSSVNGLRIGIPSSGTSEIKGVEAALLSAESVKVTGFQAGMFQSEADRLAGLQAALLRAYSAENIEGAQLSVIYADAENISSWQSSMVNTASSANGVQFGLVNVQNDADCVQLGLVNTTRKTSGAQFGFFNWASDKTGFQFGAINYNRNALFPCLLIVNYADTDAGTEPLKAEKK